MIAKELPTTLQGFFDNAWRHAVVEGNPKCTAGAMCRYRDGKGNACLIGASIPDDKYNPDSEGDAASSVMLSLDVDDDNILRTLDNLQACHDDAPGGDRYAHEVKQNLYRFAAKYNLTIPV